MFGAVSNTTFGHEELNFLFMTQAELIKALEEWRKDHGLQKTDMAALFGLKNMANYTNWLGRKSVPKDHIARAQEIIASKDPKAVPILRKRAAPKVGSLAPEGESLESRASEAFAAMTIDEAVTVVAAFLGRVELSADHRDRLARAIFRDPQ